MLIITTIAKWFTPVKRARRLSKYSFGCRTPEDNSKYSLGYVNVFKSSAGRLLMTQMPKSTAALAKQRGRERTVNKQIATIELFTTDINVSTIPVITREQTWY